MALVLLGVPLELADGTSKGVVVTCLLVLVVISPFSWLLALVAAPWVVVLAAGPMLVAGALVDVRARAVVVLRVVVPVLLTALLGRITMLLPAVLVLAVLPLLLTVVL
jgi:hypothetical protein